MGNLGKLLFVSLNRNHLKHQSILHLLIVAEDIPVKLRHVLRSLSNRTLNQVHHLMLGSTGVGALIVGIQVQACAHLAAGNRYHEPLIGLSLQLFHLPGSEFKIRKAFAHFIHYCLFENIKIHVSVLLFQQEADRFRIVFRINGVRREVCQRFAEFHCA